MAVNEKGYIRPNYDELLAARIAQAQELFGEDIDTSNASPLGKFIRLSVQDLADAFETQEIIYYSRFPNTATGQSLDRLMPFAGITRNPATRAEHSIRFVGTPNYQIPVGFLVGTREDEEFYLLNGVILDERGIGIGTVQCTELGEIGNVALGKITEIVNPDINVESIEHVAIESIGADTETDASLRKRFSVAIEGVGSATATSIRGAVMRINGVNGCMIIENNTHETVNGRPPHSFEVFVHAPDAIDQEVAETIFEKKPIGIKSVGTVSLPVKDVTGNIQTISFSRITEMVVYIKVKVAVNDDFELNGVEQIKNALVNHVNDLTAGQDVIFASLYKYIFDVVGVSDVHELSVSTDGTSYNTQNVIVSDDKVARTTDTAIVIEVVNYENN